MKITSVKAYPIRMAPGAQAGESAAVATYGDYYIAREGWTSIYSTRLETCLVRIETDEGQVGWGEGQAPVSPRTVATILEDLCRPVLVGENPHDVEYLWYRLYSAMRERGHITGFYIDALAAVDLALYDLLGKLHKLPVHRLLGGRCRDQVRVYAGFGGLDPAALAQTAREHVAAGYTALKLHLRPDNAAVVRIVRAVREAVGPQIDLMVDIHTTRDISGAIELGHALEELGVFWLESPTAPEDAPGQAEIARALRLRVATGEWLRTAYEWRPWIEQRGFDVAMPDIGRTGLSEGKRISAICDAWNLPVAPHIGAGGILAIAASIELCAALPNFLILEHSHTKHAEKGQIATAYPQPVNGAFPVTDTPGLGVTIDEAAVEKLTVR